jgi:peptidoglycan/xylan/chitin deacetylase (PgdA/CDA1 family)
LRVKYLFRVNNKFLRLFLSIGVITVFLFVGLAVYRPDAVPVLMYHSISDAPGNPLCVKPSEFEKQMHYLHEQHFHSVTLAQLESYLYRHQALPKKPFVITFDDGNKDNVSIALPILRKYEFTAAEFVPGSYVAKEGFSSEDIITLDSEGWDIGNHTYNHRMLTDLNSGEQKSELEKTNHILSSILREKKIRYFSSPVGKYNQTVLNTLKTEGFTLAFTTEHGWATGDTDPLLIPRVSVGPATNMALFRLKVNTPYYPRISEYFHKQ